MSFKKDNPRKKAFLLKRLINNVMVVKNIKDAYFFDPESLTIFSKTDIKSEDEEIISEYKTNQKILIDRKKKKKDKNFLGFSTTTLELHVINECNLKCKYCYVDDNINKENKKQMSKEVIKKAFRFALKASPSATHFNIVLFGGEPMFFWKQFEFLTKNAKEIFKDKKIRISFSTNGTIINDQVAKVLKENNISFQLSLDGTQKQQDFLRPTFQDKGSYQIIDKNIAHFKAIRDSLSVRTTITPYNMNLSKLFLVFKEKGFKKINFWLCSSEQKDLIIKQKDLVKQFSEWDKLAKIYLKHLIEDDKIVQVLQFHKFLQTLYFSRKKDSFCGIGKNVFAVSVEGNIYLCHRFVDNERYKIGDLDRGIFDTKNTFFNNSVQNEKRCKNCFAKFLCGGGCAYEKSLSSMEISCQITRHILALSIWIYGELSTKYPEAFTKLSKTLEA